ncbi:hypothetical protein [Actinophytocola sp.]|uniref:hypothetical protein n=1 Tax=Actinophytocola sp. TaxID=1872138 RepID=UPI003D6A5172
MPAGESRIADAELYLGGVEVVHIRAYADREQFAENLELAGIPDAHDRYRYVLGSLATAPSGMTGIFIGWEQLVADLVSAGSSCERKPTASPLSNIGGL